MPAASYALGTAPGTSPFLIMGTTHVVNSCLSAPDLRARALQRRGLRPGVEHDTIVAAAAFVGLRMLLAAIPSIVLRHPIKKWAAVAAFLGATFYFAVAGPSP